MFCGTWGEAKINFKDLGRRGKYFQGAEKFYFMIRGDQCIIFRDQGSTDPPGGLTIKNCKCSGVTCILLLLTHFRGSVVGIFTGEACVGGTKYPISVVVNWQDWQIPYPWK